VKVNCLRDLVALLQVIIVDSSTVA